MVKRGNENTDTTQEQSEIIAGLQKEVARLKAGNLARLGTEESIRQKGRVASGVTMKEVVDHRNISLWTKWGKRVGPMHRENALDALRRFSDVGVTLLSDKPSQSEIDAWLDSAEGVAWQKAEDKKKNDNVKTRKGAAAERMLKQMAEQYGVTMSALKGILPQNEVVKASQGPGR
jgi:hypothetical protein